MTFTSTQRLGFIPRRLLADEVYDRLLSDIITGRFAPHERLHVDRIADELGVSRTPVREALLHLQLNKFVEVCHNSRTEVADWSARDMRDRLDVMARMVGVIISDPRIDFVDLIAEGEAAARTTGGDVEGFLLASEAIVSLACNKIAGYTLDTLIRSLRLFLTVPVLFGHGIDLDIGAADRCAALLDALKSAKAGNVAQASTLFSRYAELLAVAIAPLSADLLIVRNPAPAFVPKLLSSSR